MNRMSREQILIETTKLEAKRGTCLRAQVGCVIAVEGRIVSTGYNGAPPGEPHCLDVGCQMEEGHCVRTVHAEANAIAWAARRGVSVYGGTLYTYGWPGGICHRCEKLVKSAGVIKIVEIPVTEENQLQKLARLAKFYRHAVHEIEGDFTGKEKDLDELLAELGFDPPKNVHRYAG